METNTPLISAIIPIFNTALHLNKCLSSLIAQTYKNCEFVLVDDGSQDDSLKICLEFAKKDDRFLVIHQKNQGVTIARRNGVNAASGTWITFVDSDDYLPLEAFQLMINASQNNDIIVGSIHFNSHLYKWPYISRFNKMNSYHYVKKLITKQIHSGPSARLIKKKLFTGWEFNIPPQIKSSEDWIMNIRLGLNANKILQISNTVYVYDYVPHIHPYQEYEVLVQQNTITSLKVSPHYKLLTFYYHKQRAKEKIKNFIKKCYNIIFK
jgi:glycosyltransferase involved in cell wall biosynthesis